MKRIKNFLMAISIASVVTTILFAQSSPTLKIETFLANMNSPETLVKSFIEDYFRWNEESNKKINKRDASEAAALASIGITENPPPIEKIKNNSRYVEIKGKYAEEYAKLLADIDAEYKKIVRKYCRPNYQHLNAAFGSESSHNPDNEVILSVNTVGSKSIVKTRQTRYEANTKLVDDWEFHLTYENNRWYLEQIFYIDEEGRYESL